MGSVAAPLRVERGAQGLRLRAGGDVAVRHEGDLAVDRVESLGGDVLLSMNQSGMLALIFAHLTSLDLISDVFARQVQSGKGPVKLEDLQPAG